jgi:hypothetical protein
MNKTTMMCIFASAIALNAGDLLAQRANPSTGNKVKPNAVTVTSTNYCTIKILKGTYSYAAQGNESGSPFSESGLETYDGKGGIVGLGSDSSNPENGPFNGTYSINGDCTGAVDYGDGIVYNIYVKPDGSSFSFLDKTPGNTLAGAETRISKKLILQ